MANKLPDIKALTYIELSQLEEVVYERMGELEKEQVTKLRDKWKKDAVAHGLTFNDITGGGRKRKRDATTRKPVEPKYRNPAKKSETWSGRGRKPKWVESALTSGKKLEDLLIKDTRTGTSSLTGGLRTR